MFDEWVDISEVFLGALLVLKIMSFRRGSLIILIRSLITLRSHHLLNHRPHPRLLHLNHHLLIPNINLILLSLRLYLLIINFQEIIIIIMSQFPKIILVRCYFLVNMNAISKYFYLDLSALIVELSYSSSYFYLSYQLFINDCFSFY